MQQHNVLDILEAKDEMEDTSESIGLKHLRMGIKFEKVSFLMEIKVF